MTPTQTASIKSGDDGRFVPTTVWGVPVSDDPWLARVLDYDLENQYLWEMEFCDKKEVLDETAHEVSDIQEGDVLRLSGRTQKHCFRVDTIADDEIEFTEIPEQEAKEFFQSGGELPMPTVNTAERNDPSKGSDTSSTKSATGPDTDDGVTEVDSPTTKTDSGTTTQSSSTDESSASTTDDSSSSDTSSSQSGSGLADIPKKKRRLPTNSDIGELTAGEVFGGIAFDADGNPVEDLDDVPIIGYQVIYTTGSSLLVPRDDLINKMDELGFIRDPSKPTLEEQLWLAPSKNKTYNAFLQACDDLLHDSHAILGHSKSEENAEKTIMGYGVEIKMEKNGSRYNRTLAARRHIPEEENGEPGGRSEYTELGQLRYYSDEGSYSATRKILNPNIEGTTGLDIPEEIAASYVDLWDKLVADFEVLVETHKDHHVGGDINGIVTDYLGTTESIQLREACYFIPAIYDDLNGMMDALHELYEWLNNYKIKGDRTHFDPFPVLNAKQHKETIQRRVESRLENQIDKLFAKIEERMLESNDEIASEIAESLLAEETSEMENLTQKYAKITQGKVSVQKHLREHLGRLEDTQRQELVMQVMDESGMDFD